MAVYHRNRIAWAILCTIILMASLALPSSIAHASTLDVCLSGCTYTTIQSAINTAVSGDTVNVQAGIYVENLTIAKSITLVGAQVGVDATDRTGLESTVQGVIFLDAPDITLDGLKLDQGGSQWGEYAGVYLNNTATGAVLQNLLLTGAGMITSPARRGILGVGGISNVSVTHSRFSGWASGFYFNPISHNVTIDGNLFKGNDSAGSLDGPDQAQIINNTFDTNTSDLTIGPDWLTNQSATAAVSGNEFAGSDHYIGVYDPASAATTVVNATDNTFEGKKPIDMTLAELFALEDKIDHKLDDPAIFTPYKGGLVLVKTNQLFVTPDSGSIQRGIDAASGGYTLHIAAGTFNENLNLNQRVSLIGAGSDADPAANTIVRKGGTSNAALLSLSASGLSAANPLLIQDLRIEPVEAYGIQVPGGTVSYVSMNRVKVIGSNPNTGTENEMGLRVESGGSLSNLVVTDSAFNNLHFGWYIFQDPAVDPVTSVFDHITVNNTEFKHNAVKGMYVEKMSNATFTDVTVDGNGWIGSVYFNSRWNAGIDINMKGHTTYQNLAFNNLTVTNNANGTRDGAGMMIKARGTGDDASYAAHPAILDGVTITGGTFTGNERGIRVGEPGKNNTSPVNVQIKTSKIGNNIPSYTGTDGSTTGELVNVTTAEVNAEGNYWGTLSWYGYGTVKGIQNRISGLVDWEPWSNADLSQTLNKPLTGYADLANASKNEGETGANGGVVGYNAFATIMDAIHHVAAGATVYVGAGTYVEQVEIATDLTLVGEGSTTVIQSPAKLTTFFTTSGNNYPVVYAHAGSDIQIRDLVVDGAHMGSANYKFIGVGFFNAGGAIQNVTVKNITDTTFSGAQHGVGIYAYNMDGTARNLTVKDNTVVDFQKTAIALNGAGLTVDVEDNTVTGAGPTSVTAQNGIQVSYNAAGVVGPGNQVSDISYTGANWTATGLLIYGQVDVTGNTVTNTQAGIYFITGSATISGNTVSATAAGTGVDAYYGILIYDPPTHLPSPMDNPPTTSSVQRASSDVVQVTGNTVTGGSDGDYTWGIGAYTGYMGNDLNVTITGNDVSGWGYGLETWTCEGTDCAASQFTGITITDNRIFNNQMGMDSNVTVTAAGNWWGTLSWYGYQSVTGIKDLIDGPITWEPWANEDLSMDLTKPTSGFTDDNNLGIAEGTTGANGGIFGYNAFATINDTLNHVVSGSTIQVGAGTYPEAVTLPPDKPNLTLSGAGADTTIIESPAVRAGYTLTLTGENDLVEGFTIRQGSAGSNSIAVNWGYQGSGSTLRTCRVEGHITGIYLSSGVSDATIENNLITGNANGILFEQTLTDTVIRHNEIGDNTLSDDYWTGKENAAIRVLPAYTGSGVQILENSIYGSAMGLDNNSAATIDARHNWWGSASGPQVPSNTGGSGSAISSLVTYDPWICNGTDSDPLTLGFQPLASAETCTAVPTRLVYLVQPGNSFAGEPLVPQPMLRAEDANGNVAINFNHMVALSISNNPSGGALVGLTTLMPVNGVVTFSGLSIDKIGTGYSLVAMSSGLDYVISSPFDVLAPEADLKIALTDSPDPLLAGGTLTYTISVTNLSGHAAANVSMVDTLPTGATFVSANGDGWTCGWSGVKVTCTRPNLAANSVTSITLIVTAPNRTGTLSNSATVTSDTVDPNNTNNIATEVTTLAARTTDLSLQLSGVPAAVNAGADFSYQVAIDNLGDNQADSITVTSQLANGTTLVSAAGDGWTCSEADGTVTCTRASLAAGENAAITFTVTTPSQPSVLTLSAEVSSVTPDTNSDNNADSKTTIVAGIPPTGGSTLYMPFLSR